MIKKILLFSKDINLIDDFRDWCDYKGFYLTSTSDLGYFLLRINTIDPDYGVIDTTDMSSDKLRLLGDLPQRKTIEYLFVTYPYATLDDSLTKIGRILEKPVNFQWVV